MTSNNPALYVTALAGSSAHLIETATLGHLLDRLTVEQQAFSSAHSLGGSLRSVSQKGGFYKGFRWNVLLSATKGAGGWSIHNFCNRNMNALFPQKKPADPPFRFTALVACSTAFAETTLFLCPLERLKVLEMTNGSPQKIEAIKMIWAKGTRFVYRGWTLMVFHKSWNWMNYLGIYQQLRRQILNFNDHQPLTTYQKIALGGGTGSLVACCNTPMDLLKTQVQKQGTGEFENIGSIALSFFKKLGWRGMFRGLQLKVIRTTWATAITTLVLDRFNALPQNMKI